jgi:membrane-bound serine protease (ClpP class)
VIPLAAAAESPAGEAMGAGALIVIATGLVLVGLALFFAEALFPTFGVATLSALGCFVAAIMVAFEAGTVSGIVISVLSVFSVPAALYLGFKVLRRTPIILNPPARENGEASAGDLGFKAGAKGVVTTPLRPAGVATFDGRRVSVVSTGSMVDAGEQVEIVRVEGIRTVVRPVRAR